MTTWDEFAAAAPETAAVFERRLATTGLALLATTRSDGFPRISPVEPTLAAGQLWIGSMPGSTKSADLRRDPRCCLHSATEDKDVADGDAKLWAVAHVTTDDDRRVFVAAVKETTGNDLGEMPGGFDLWRLDIVAGSSLVLAESKDHLRITAWKAGGQERIIPRY